MAKKKKSEQTKQPTYSSIKDTAIKQITKNYNTAVGNTQEKKPTVGVMFNTNTSNNYMRRMAEQTIQTREDSAKRQEEKHKQAMRTYATLVAGNKLIKNQEEQRRQNPRVIDSLIRGTEKIRGQEYTKKEKLNAYLDSIGKKPAAAQGIQQLPTNSAVIRSSDEIAKAQRENIQKQYEDFQQRMRAMSPAEKYAALSDDKKSRYLNPSTNEELKKILSVDEAKRYVNESNLFDIEGTQQSLKEWRGKQAQAEKLAERERQEIEAKQQAEGLDNLKNEYWDVKGQLGVYSQLDAQGLNVSYRDQYGDWHADETYTKRPDDYYDGNRREDYDALLYDRINGKGAYDKRVNGLETDADVEQLEQEMDDLWNRLENKQMGELEKQQFEKRSRAEELEGLTTGYSADRRAAESEARYAAEQVKKLETQERWLLQYKEIMGQNPNPTEIGFIPENDRGREKPYTMMDHIDGGVKTDDVHRIYSFVNRGKEFQAWAAYQDIPKATDEYSCAMMMNDDQISVFNDFYNKGQYAEAQQFIKGLQPYLRTIYQDNFANIDLQETAHILPISSTVVSRGMQAVDTALAPAGIIANALGDKSTEDPTSGWYKTVRERQALENTVAEDLGKYGKTYLVGVNSIRNVINGLMTKGLGAGGPWQKVASLLTFASQIYQESTYNYLKETKGDYGRTRGLAALDAVMETLEELLPYEAMLGDSTRPVLYFAKNALSEAGEEFTGATVGEYVKALITGESTSVEKRADQIYNEGGYYDEKGKWVRINKSNKQEAINKADMQALREWENEVKENTIAGAAGGGMGSIYGGISYLSDTYNRGRTINSQSLNDEGKSGAQRLYDLAMSMDEDTESRKMAEKIKATEGENVKAGNFKLGRLANKLAMENQEAYGNTIQDTIAQDVEEKLARAGVTGPDAEAYRDIITKSVFDGEMSNKDMRTLAKDEKAIEVWKQYNIDTEENEKLAGQIKENTKQQRSVLEQIGEMTSKKESTAAPVRQTREIAKFATQDEIRSAEAQSERTGGQREVIVDGKFANVKQIRVEKTGDKWQTRVELEDGRTVGTSQLLATNYGMAQIINQAAVNPEFYSEQYTNMLMKAQEAGRISNTEKALEEATRIRIAAYIGNKMPQTSLDRQLASEIYVQSANEHAENGKRNLTNLKKGTVKYGNAEYGTKEYNEAVSKLDANLRSAVDYVANVFHAAGIELNMEDMQDDTVYGTYNTTTKGVSINLFGKDYTIDGEAKGRHNIVVTAAHELTHWLKEHSPAAYKRLEQYVMQQYASKDYNEMVRRINHFMYQDGLSLEDAIDEIVANSSDQVLGDEKTVEHIRQTDSKLFGQIRSFVQDLVERMKKAIAGMRDSASKDARFMLANRVNQINKLWTGAWDEALGRVGQETEAQPAEEQVKNSHAESKTGEGGFEEDKYFNRIIQNSENYTGNSFIKVGRVVEGGALNQVGIPVNDVRYDKSKIRYNLQKHESWLTPELLAEIPDILQHPILITEYSEPNTITVFGNKTVNGQPMMVGVVVTKDRKGLLVQPKIRTVNIRSDYGRMINDDNVLYITTNKKEALNWFQVLGINAPIGGNQFGLIRRIQLTDKNVNKKLSKAETKNSEGALAGSTAIDTGNKEQAVTPSTSEIINDMASAVKLDQEYEDAANRGDIKKTTEMLLDKLADTQGVIPFMAPEWDAGEAGKVARLLKVADPEAIATAADKMSDYVPDNAVLIPMPGHEGTLTEDSWSVKLAEAIGERTGRPVVLALEGVDRESRHEAKKNNAKGISQEEMGFRQVEELPEGTFPIFVDNEVGTGITADAAQQAIGGGITLAYTKSLRSPGIRGLKNVVVTHESKKNGGGLIPLSERFNVDKRDVRYSKAEEALDAGVWLMNQTVGSFQTEDERTLWQAYKDKRISMSLCLKRQMDYRSKISELENKDSLTREQQQELETVRDKLEKQQERMAQLEKEMQEITSTEGYAGMMYRYNMVLKDFVQGRTSDQVRETVEGMLEEVKAAQEQITRQAEELKQLEQTQAVNTMKSFLGKTSLGQQASMLRKNYNSLMNKTEIENRLAEMALKLASGQDIQTDAEALATDLVDKIRGIRSENLESLRGITLNIGQSLQKELKAENSSMKELRTAIYGSGVKIKAEGNSRLTEQWNELRNDNQSLPDIDGMPEIDALHTIIDYISGELQASSGSGQYDVNMEEAAAICYGAAASVTTYIVKDPAARKQITELMGQIRDLSRRTGNIAEGMDQLNAKMQEVVQAGYKAADWTGILQNDVHTAIDYYNKVARQAAQEEKAQVKKNLIDQLRSENARKLYEQQDKYEQQLRDSRKARETAEENQTLRSKINTNVSRLRKRLTEETDKQNIPEETKALARYLCGKLVNHDMTDGLRRVLFADKNQLADFSERLKRMDAEDGGFDADRDLDWLVIKAPNAEDNDYTLRDKVVADLRNIDNGLLMYWTAEGNGLNSLENRKEALKEISDAVAEITSAIRARGQAFINNKRYELADLAERMEDEMSRSAFKGERRGFGSRAMNGIERGIGYGNLTPEYFFKNLKNSVASLLHKGFNSAENRSGLMAAESQAKMEEIAEETGFRTWDGQEKHRIKVNGGREIDITTEQLMALYATWQREKNNLRPEATAHLLKGGFVLAQEDTSKGKPGRERIQQRPVRMTRAQLDGLGDMLTDQQKAFVEKVVEYMSTDLAEVANETSMETYGIRKFTEKYYFPIKSWGGVLSKESTRGVGNKNDNAAMRQSFTKRITAGAQNAIEIGDFTPTAMRHIAGMITFNTVGPAVENLNRVLNYNLQYGEVTYDEGGEVEEDNTYKRSVRAAFQEAYGKNALDYLQQFMQDINGGTAQGIGNTVFDKLLSTFRKGAVAGSLSVALQQPLSYIRAAMMINPKYLASAIAPWNWGKIHEEMTKYSGIAVIKDMGRFDMQLGRSMIDYITPDGKESGLKTAWTKFSDATTILPEKMDAITWGRMWIACKMEQAALQPGVDQTSDEFLQTVAERFNEVMRRTQVYDSVMVKSQNMRTRNPFIKSITSFMAEPTLSLNVLSDAVKNAGQKGGKTNLAKAGATFLLSAALQALVKGLMSSGRSPDKKKTWEEQFLAKWFTAFMSEANPLSLIPGYSDLIELLKNGELSNDALGVIGKVKTITQTTINGLTGKGKGAYRDLEDTVGQLAQIFTNVPVKNLMRDARAMYNFFNPDTYANRATSAAVIKYSVKDAFYTADNMLGVVNTYLQMAEAGYGTTKQDYIQRLYDAEKAGQKKEAESIIDYLVNVKVSEPAKGTKQDSINSSLRTLIKKDDGLTYKQKIQSLRDKGMKDSDIASWIKTEYTEDRITKTEAEKLYVEANPAKTANDAYFLFEQAEYEELNNVDLNDSAFFRLDEAMRKSDQRAVERAEKELLEHGKTEDDVKNRKKSFVINQYKDGKLSTKQAEDQLKKWRPDLTADDVYWTLDLIDYKKETGNNSASGKSYRLMDAMTANKLNDINTAVKAMLSHGVKKESIKSSITSYWKEKYLAAKAGSAERTAMKDAIQKAYKAIGLTAADADKVINGWLKPKKTTK